jgi:hypothetical protein
MTIDSVWMVALATSLGSCTAAAPETKGTAPLSAKARADDSEPRTSKLSIPLPSGASEALFAVDTGGDQMTTGARKAARLVLIVRYGASEIRQIIASCRETALGSALGGGTPTDLEVAGCDGEYRLVSIPGEVLVQRIDDGHSPSTVTRIPLPSKGMRAVSPTNRDR